MQAVEYYTYWHTHTLTTHKHKYTSHTQAWTHTHICAHKSRSQRAHTLTYPQTHSLSPKNTFSSISSVRLTAKESGCLVEMLERRVKSDYSLTQLPSAAGGRSLLLPPHLPSLASFFPQWVSLSASLLCTMVLQAGPVVRQTLL